jgi:hypothetical protein
MNKLYKFDIHLLELSQNKDLETAKKEWEVIYIEKRADKTGLCICQHTIKNINYVKHRFTKQIIHVGTTCCKKLQIKLNPCNNNIYQTIMKMNMKGEYKVIDNLLEYVQNVQQELIKCIEHKYKKDITNLEKLKELSNEIKYLINTYDLKDLQNIYDEIMNKIISIERIEFERKETTRIEFERKEITRIEFERKELERKEIERKETKRIKIERKEIEENIDKLLHKNQSQIFYCSCSIMEKHICICETPNYVLQKINNNLYCVNCRKWKCRCKNVENE